MDSLSYGKIILYNQSLHEIFPDNIKYTFGIIYEGSQHKTYMILVYHGIRYIKQFSGNLFSKIFDKINGIFKLPFDFNKPLYYGDELQVESVFKGQRFIWRNLSARNCIPNYHILHAGSMLDPARPPYNEFQIGQTSVAPKYPPTIAQQKYDFIVGLVSTIMETAFRTELFNSKKLIM